MRGDPRSAAGLAYAGFQIVSMANNHAMDHGRIANVQTMETLREHGVDSIGAVEDRSPQKILDVRGTSIAFLAYSFVGARTIHPWSNKQVLTTVEEDIRRIRKDADFVIVSVHWGYEFVDRPSPHVYWLAHEMVDYGADVVLGHHPHVIQGIETYRGKLVAYSLGNFVFDMWADTRETFILRVRLQERDALSYDIVPVRIGDEYQPIPEVGEPARRIARRITVLSQQLGYSSRQTDIDQQAKQYELQAKFCHERYKRIMRRYFLMNMYRYPPKYLIRLIRNSLLWHLK
jgi:poly-gamma-glutamate synthesis protein (capsule biosynthesis protein)